MVKSLLAVQVLWEMPGSISGSGRCPEGGHGNPLQYSCLENPTDRGAWRAATHGVTKSWTRLNNELHMLKSNPQGNDGLREVNKSQK